MMSKEHISLYGDEDAVAGWQRLLDQEKTPYEYKGTKLKHFSQVNIFVGCNTSSVDFPSDKVAIVEPESYPQGVQDNIVAIQTFLDGNETVRVHGFAKLEDPKKHWTLGTFKETELFTEQTFPVVIRRGKTYYFQTNLSTQLILPGFGFRPISELSSEDSQVQLYAALTDKEKISRFLQRILVEGLHRIGRPYIHLWYYPTSRPTIMLFRQDVDYVDDQGVDALIQVTKRHGIRGTYFINMSGEEEVEDEIGHLQLDHPITVDRRDLLLPLLEEGNEFANHGYWHWVFDDVDQNVRNIQQCSQYFVDAFGVHDKGFAAPGGTWNHALARAIDRTGIIYSSNITLDMGGFPYHVVHDGGRARALEIPCNPISDVAFDPHPDPEELKRLQVYYLSYIDQQMATHEPITVLGHPHLSGRSADTFYPPIFEKIAEEDIPVMRYHDFANWWLKREMSSLTMRADGRHIELAVDGNCSLIEIIYASGRKIIPVDGNIAVSLDTIQ